VLLGAELSIVFLSSRSSTDCRLLQTTETFDSSLCHLEVAETHTARMKSRIVLLSAVAYVCGLTVPRCSSKSLLSFPQTWRHPHELSTTDSLHKSGQQHQHWTRFLHSSRLVHCVWELKDVHLSHILHRLMMYFSKAETCTCCVSILNYLCILASRGPGHSVGMAAG
jgi:hypothetical protein